MKRVSAFRSLWVPGIALIVSGCGLSSPTADSTNLNLGLVPVFAMSSIIAPVEVASSAVSSSRIYQPLNLSTFSLSDTPVMTAVVATPSEVSVESWSTELAKIRAIAAATTEAECFSSVDFNITPSTVDCYGPQLMVVDYPGVSSTNFGTGGTCGIAAGTSTLGSTSIGDGCLPSGDVGIYSSLESGQACSAAKMNSLIADTGAVINNALKINAGIVCIMGLEGRDKLVAGGSYNAKAIVESKFSNSDVTAAKIERLDDDADGNEVYLTSIEGTFPAGSATLGLKLSIVNKSQPDGSASKGRVSGYFDSAVSEELTLRKGFSASFAYSADAVAFDLRSATTASTATVADLFDTNGVYQYAPFTAGGATSSTAQYLVASLDPTTGVGKMVYAWQAGGSDTHARVFQVETAASESAVTAYSYFAFGPPVSSTSLGTITEMICNWTPPSGGAARAAVSSKAQAQVMEFDAATGKFKPTSTGDHFLFYPTANCDFPGGTYRVGTTLTEVGGAAPAITTNALATYNDPAIGVFTAPAAPAVDE